MCSKYFNKMPFKIPKWQISLPFPFSFKTAHRWLRCCWALGCDVGGREFNSGRTNTQGLNILNRNFCLFNHINKWLDFQVFSDKDYKPEVPSHNHWITVGRQRTHKLFVKNRPWSSRCCGLASLILFWVHLWLLLVTLTRLWTAP